MFSDRESSWHRAEGPGSASTAPPATRPHQFITDATYRSLWVTQLKHKDPEIYGPLQDQYKVLLSALPDSPFEKPDAEQLQTEEGMKRAISNLVT